MIHTQGRTLRIAYVIDSPGLCSPSNGGELKRRTIAAALARLGEVSIVVVPLAAPGNGSVTPSVLAVDGFEIPLTTVKPLAGDIRSASVVHRLARVIQPRARQRLIDAGVPLGLLQQSPQPCVDVVVLDAPHLFGTASSFASPVIFVTHNNESRTFLKRAGASHVSLHQRGALCFAAGETALYERRAAKACTQLWAVSEADAAAYGRRFRGIDVRLAPNVIAEIPPMVGTPQIDPPMIGFLGSLGYGPNREAAFAFAELVDRLRATGLQFDSMVVGGGADAALTQRLNQSQVITTGFVDDLHVPLSKLAALVTPLGPGGGTKLKTLEALARGLPLITTPAGVEGLDLLQRGVHAHVENIGPAFDAAVVSVIHNPVDARGMGVVGREWALANFGPDRLQQLISTHIVKICGSLPELAT
jgi:glycosyltransferase involved in cell wall biosynthesis